MVEIEAKKVVLKNLAGEYLVPITEPYVAGDGIKIEDNIISADIGEIRTAELQNKANVDASNFTNTGKNYLSGLGMPSDKYINLTLGASGSQYTAPANGYFLLAMRVGNGYYMRLRNINNEFFVEHSSHGTSNVPAINISVKKGDVVAVTYDFNEASSFRFYYALGDI